MSHKQGVSATGPARSTGYPRGQPRRRPEEQQGGRSRSAGLAKFSSVAVPPLTRQQRADALTKAAAARKDRSELRAKLRSGSLGLAEVLDGSALSGDATVTKMRVSALLEALPGVGKTRAAQIIERLDIAANRRVGGLGVHQRRALVAEFQRRANAQRARTNSRTARMNSTSESGT